MTRCFARQTTWSTLTSRIALVQPRPNPYRVGPVLIRPDELQSFDHALHDGYSGLNPEEGACARELVATGQAWCRNPSRSGYGIPLINLGRTTSLSGPVTRAAATSTPSTPPEHLLADRMGRKLLSIRPPRDSSHKLHVRFLSEGKQELGLNGLNDLDDLDDEGYTVWSRRPEAGTIRTSHVDELGQAVATALQPG